MKPLKEKISITVDSDLLEKLKYEAEKDDRSLSQYINLALKQHLKAFEKRILHNKKGISRGRFLFYYSNSEEKSFSPATT